MSFVEHILTQLQEAGEASVLQKPGHGHGTMKVSGRDLLSMVNRARAFLEGQGLKKGDRVALLAHNSVRWVAMDLAIIAEGLIVVPLYARQAAIELAGMMKDCSPSLICCGDGELRDGIVAAWPEAPPQHVFDLIFGTRQGKTDPPELAEDVPVTIIYT